MTEIKFGKVYDLSMLTYTNMVMHPANAKIGERARLTLINSPRHVPQRPNQAIEWPVIFHIEMPSHTGTHIDSPLHVKKNGKSIDELPIEKFMGEGVVLDMRHKGPSEAITPKDLENSKPEIHEGDIVIINTGWHEKWSDTAEYLEEHPGLNEDSGYYLLEKKVKMIGTDTMCPEVGSEESHWQHPLHRLCLIENEVPLLEILGGEINEVTGKRCYIVAVPIKMTTDAAPTRVLAFL
ncbi:MAG: cyclase family protein [Deltaproteobacteria bacterium]|nr:cyclase family protein [Deltaproteobacteria bacterium]